MATMGSNPIAFIQHEESTTIDPPSPVVHRQDRSIGPINIELDEYPFESWSPNRSAFASPKGAQTPINPGELERSRPTSPERQRAADIVPSLTNPPMNKWRMATACVQLFRNGMNDSAPGALIPYMETDYRIGYAVVSLIFVTNAVGFIAAAFFSDILQSKFGRAKGLMFAEVMLIAGFIMIVSSPPFPVIVVSFLLLGLGLAFNLAINNVFVANLAESTTALGFFHGSYGVGGTVGPLMATAMASHGIPWSHFYFILLGISVVNFFASGWSFWNYEKEAPQQLLSALERTVSRQTMGEGSKLQLLKEALRHKVTIIGALFIFAYQGAEVSISGWVISFLIKVRGGDPAKVGYVTSGFWGGVTVGRFVLTHFARRIGERISVTVLVLGAIGFQLLVWFVPNIIGEAVAVSIVGLLIGPIFPCATTVFSRLLSRKIQMASLAFISATGSSGGAIAPFTTGILAQSVGTFVLHPIAIGLFVVMEICWFCLSRVKKVHQ